MFIAHHKRGRRDKDSEPQQSKVWESQNPQLSLRFLSLEIVFPGKKMAMKAPIGAGLSLASPPSASNDRSLVLKSAFFGHGGTVLSDSLSDCRSNFVFSAKIDFLWLVAEKIEENAMGTEIWSVLAIRKEWDLSFNSVLFDSAGRRCWPRYLII